MRRRTDGPDSRLVVTFPIFRRSATGVGISGNVKSKASSSTVVQNSIYKIRNLNECNRF